MVNLIDIYPTLIELCGLPKKASLDGRTFASLLKQPSQTWTHPTLTVFGEGNSSIHGDRYHFIRYKDGTEEFYDLVTDPMEWENLAPQLTEEQKTEKQRLAELIPEKFASPIKENDKTFNRADFPLNQSIKATRPLERLK